MKRNFEGFALQQPRHLSEDPSRDYQEPAVTPALQHTTAAAAAAPPVAGGTVFADWTEPELRAFLDQRGEDFDDCHDFSSLCQRAVECEINTGTPAVRPILGDTTAAPTTAGAAAEEEEQEEVDPLDAFMAEISAIEKVETAAPSSGPAAKKKPRAAAAAAERFEADDNVAEFMERRKKGGSAAAAAGGGGATVGAVAAAAAAYDSDEEVYAAAKAADLAAGVADEFDEESLEAQHRGKMQIQPMAALDHAELDYADFNKDFYTPVPQLAALNPAGAEIKRQALGMRVAGWGAPAPVETFGQCGFDAALLGAIKKAGFLAPTPIQAQALPVVLSGRDVLGVAKTGSGKTAAFLLPMMVHVMDQPELDKGEGPIALVAAPTRELAEQIHREARRFGRPYNLKVCAAFGGLSKAQQIKELRAGAEIAICTPGRMLDLIKAKACTARRVTYVVLDEADRMFDLGFEPQIRSLLGQIRPDRQTLLFSATMPRKVERLAADALSSPVRISVGATGAANEDVKQVVAVLEDESGKRQWLEGRLPGFVDDGDVLVFAGQRGKVEELAAALGALGVARVGALHGEMAQASRMEVLKALKEGRIHVLVATDVAARGLDVKTVKTVVNYDPARDADTHVHRVGRTGRAGDKEGVAYTLLTPRDGKAAAEVERCLVAGGQEVPKELHELAWRYSSKGRHKGGKGGKGGGGGGGQKERRGRQVGGCGLGFGPEISTYVTGGAAAAMQQHATAVSAGQPLPGFAPSHDREDAHFTAAAGSVAAVPLLPPAVPPPLPPPLLPPPPGAAPLPRGPAAEWVASRAAAVGRSHQSAFVSSGVRQGDVGVKPEIVLPKLSNSSGGSGGGVMTSRPLPPPPIPVTQRPLFIQRQQYPQQQARGPSTGGMPPAVPPGTQMSAGQQSEEVQRAIAQAKAIAARLTAQGGGAGQPQGGQQQQHGWGNGR